MKTYFFRFFALVSGGIFFSPLPVAAHVQYVISKSDFANNSGSDIPFLLSAFSHFWINLALCIGAIIFFCLIIFLSREPFWKKEFTSIKKKSKTYLDLIPWILRLSIGIALVGAGASHVLISPVVSTSGIIALFELVLGFCILIGFFLSITVFAALALYFFALVQSPNLIGSLEFVTLCFAFLTLGNGRPSFDDLFGVPDLHKIGHLSDWVPFCIRIGIGGAMMFSAFFEKFLHPHASALVVQLYHMNDSIFLPLAVWVAWAGIIEFLLGFFCVIGFHVRLVSAITFFVIMLSFFFFGEAVYAHITLFGGLSVLFIMGAGKKLAVDNKS